MSHLSTLAELTNKIQLGEDQYLELKEVQFTGNKISGPKQNEIANEIAAFANSEGGEILFGVEDKNRLIVGIPIEKLDIVEDAIRQAASDSINPVVAPIIERVSIDNEAGNSVALIRVFIRKSLFIHQSPSGYLHRIGSSKRPIAPEHLARLFQQRSQSRIIRFDETPVPTAEITDLKEQLYLRFIPNHGNEFNLDKQEEITYLNKLAMIAKDESAIWRPTVAGILLGSSKPEKFLPHAYIQAIAYRGTNKIPDSDNKIYQQDALDITGPLDEQIHQACDFVRKNMFVGATKHSQGGRIDLPQYDMLAVFEAITNAVAHRDYSMAGSKIRLHMFGDRLEIYTPGMLPNTMSTDSLAFRQAARNEVITSLLARCPVREDIRSHRKFIMDKRGEGVPIILHRSKQLSGKEAVYQLHDSSELQLTIYAAYLSPTS